MPPGDASLLEQRPSTDSSTPRKAAAPKRRSGSSSSSDSSVKRRRLSFTADRQREPSPEIQAFTSVPVPLLNPTADPAVVTSTGRYVEASSYSNGKVKRAGECGLPPVEPPIKDLGL